jgi:HD-like signal output (HDOD) protein
MATSTGIESGAVREASRMSLTSMIDRHLELPSLSLPVCAESAAHVLGELESTGADSAALERIVGRDPALVATVLREANGPEFDALDRVGAIPTALARLGDERVGDLLASVATHSRLETDDSVLTEALERTWKRSLAIAMVAPIIAERTWNEDLAQDSHLLGLLSEVGAVFLISSLHTLRTQCADRPPLSAVAEREVLDQLQEAYGIRLLERWNFPSGVLAVLAGRPTARDEQKQSLFLRMARQVVSSIGVTPVGADGDGLDENELWELAEALELSYVDVAALQVRAEDLEASLQAE